MSQRLFRSIAVMLFIAGLVWAPLSALGQTAKNTGTAPRATKKAAPAAAAVNGTWSPSTRNGDWPHYTGDLTGARYSPLDQINADNFNKLEVAWRFKTDNLGTRPEFKLEGTPLVVDGILYATAGTRRSVVALKADTGELIWVHTEFEGKRAINAPRQLSGRGLSYWPMAKAMHGSCM